MALFRDSDTLKKIGKSEIYNGIIKNLRKFGYFHVVQRLQKFQCDNKNPMTSTPLYALIQITCNPKKNVFSHLENNEIS